MTTGPKKTQTDTDKPRPDRQELKKSAVANRVYESITSQDFMAIHKTLLGIQKQLSHPEFRFLNYLLTMTIQEFTKPGDADDPLTK